MSLAPETHMTNSELADKVVLITGGSRGIGLAAAKSLGALGATVVLVGRNPENLKLAVSDLVGLLLFENEGSGLKKMQV
jgi:NAD(P)-dependent dehydrogenase (short-subunit alcohol dehydrogenase family)